MSDNRESPKVVILPPSNHDTIVLNEVVVEENVNGKSDEVDEDELQARELIEILNSSMSNEHKESLVNLIDDKCIELGSLSLPMYPISDDMKDSLNTFLWKYPHTCVIDGGHPLLNRIGTDEGEPLVVDDLMQEDSDVTITKSLGELIPRSNVSSKQVWVLEITLKKIEINYTKPVEIRSLLPDSTWTVWKPIPKAEELKKKKDGGSEFIEYRSRTRDLLRVPIYKNKTFVKRNRMLALYAAGEKLADMTKVVPNDNTMIFLERNLATIIIIETLIASQTTTETVRMLESILYCHDGRLFKMKKTDFEEIVKMTEGLLEFNDLFDTCIEVRTFSGEPWYKSQGNSTEPPRFRMKIWPIISARYKEADITTNDIKTRFSKYISSTKNASNSDDYDDDEEEDDTEYTTKDESEFSD